MIILDTDHLSILQYASPKSESLSRRLVESDEAVFATVISLEEQSRGWISVLGRYSSDLTKQVQCYQRICEMHLFYSAWNLLTFSDTAAGHFERLRREKVRIGSSDLKVASIALSQDALLLTANTRDFEKVRDLRSEDWLGD
ncbi:MAG: type II toxin-antitoxin system VapC family toxin [Planctomycetaceae bacterium]|nr:type II toxin-antitoxin system VapC family toxin [Planctomycetaceae bacterium]